MRQRGGLALRVDLKTRPAGIAVEFGLGGVRQRGVAVDHQGQRGFVELADVVEQKIARFAHIAGALPDAAGGGDDGRFERAGQHNHLIIAALAQLAPELPALFQIERAVAEGVFQNAAYFGHALKHRHRPFGREHINGAAGVQILQAAVERLGHHAIAYPAGGNDEDFFRHGKVGCGVWLLL